MLSYLKIEGNKCLFTGKYMEAYIPEFYFKTNNLAEINGDFLNVIGIFTFRVFNTDDINEVNKLRSKTKLNSFNLPVTITTNPSSKQYITLSLLGSNNVSDVTNKPSNDETTVDIDENDDDIDEAKYLVLQYYENDTFLENINVIQNSNDMVKFMALINSGKIPNTVPYDKLSMLQLNASKLVGVNLGVTAATVEMTLSELCRDPKNVNRPFRYAINQDKSLTVHDYKMASIKKIATLNSTFTALTFEDMTTSLVYSINRNTSNEPELVSPAEKVIKY